MVSSSSAFASVLDTLRGSLIDKPAREIHTRIAHANGCIFYDLGDESGRVVEITPDGWSICERSPVAFIRPKGMRAQVEPLRDGNAKELRNLLNVEEEKDFVLILAFILGYFQPVGAKVHLGFLGEQGTGKTGMAHTVRAMIDPNDAPTRSEPREPGDLIVAASNNSVLGFDNLSHISHWCSDFFCRLSTGSGDGKRKLYEDDEEVIFAFKRSVIFNAITEVATKPDLLDRTILIELPVISEAKRRSQSQLDRQMEQLRPYILGSIFDAVAVGLQRFEGIEIDNKPRMADFAVWVEACAPGLGWKPNKFLGIYRENRQETAESAVEICTLANFITDLWIDKGRCDFKGTPQELFEAINQAAKPNYAGGDATDIRSAKDWPKDATSMGKILKRFAPNLRKKGIEVIQGGRSNGKRICEIKLLPKNLWETGS